MNYLAHAYLSFEDPTILAGNMVSDFVKGKKKFDYPPAIQQGIMLHREIDQFTDFHPVTKEAQQLLKPACGAYAGAFADIIYDHFLALDKNIFPADSLHRFAKDTYDRLEKQEAVFPERFRRFLFYMRTQDWLYNYQFREGIFNSFAGLTRRATYIDDPAPAFAAFEKHYTALNNCYKAFIPDVKEFAYQRFIYLRPPA